MRTKSRLIAATAAVAVAAAILATTTLASASPTSASSEKGGYPVVEPSLPPPSEQPCGPDEECVYASDEVEMYEEATPTPTPTLTPAPIPSATATVAVDGIAPQAVAQRAGVQAICGTAGLRALLRGPRGARFAALGGAFGVQSFVGAPITVTARRQTVINGAVMPLDNDGGVGGPLYNVTFAPRVVPRPVNVTITESGAFIGPVFFTFAGGRICRGTRPLVVNVALP